MQIIKLPSVYVCVCVWGCVFTRQARQIKSEQCQNLWNLGYNQTAKRDLCYNNVIVRNRSEIANLHRKYRWDGLHSQKQKPKQKKTTTIKEYAFELAFMLANSNGYMRKITYRIQWVHIFRLNVVIFLFISLAIDVFMLEGLKPIRSNLMFRATSISRDDCI